MSGAAFIVDVMSLCFHQLTFFFAMSSLVDMATEKLEGEARDLKQGAAFHSRTEILSSSGYEITSNSRLVIITAGCARKPGEARLNLMQRNVGIMKSIIPQVLEYSPNAAICIISNPCDVMTAVSFVQLK